jgi:4-hydroxy-4-methyl-2-oxoglutarate aldolase
MNVDPALLSELARHSSYAVANAVDSLGLRMRNEGASSPSLVCRTPTLAPMVGIALTLTMRSANPTMKPGFYLEHASWWETLPRGVLPRVLVIQDLDEAPGGGALVGPVQACILGALGLTGVVTNGALRGVDTFQQIGLGAYSGGLTPSHAYGHVVEAGGRVEVSGMSIAQGDIVHGDRDGIVTFPAAMAAKVPSAAAAITAREREICAYCDQPDFSPAGLRMLIGHSDNTL